MIYAFLPLLRYLKNAFAIEVHSSFSEPASYGFLDCLVSLVMVTSQAIFQGPELEGAKFLGLVGAAVSSHFLNYP
jgi:hypothetical protein